METAPAKLDDMCTDDCASLGRVKCLRRGCSSCSAVAQTSRLATEGAHYDTRLYFNVRSKADMSQLNLPHGNRQIKSVKHTKTEKLKSKNGYAEK